jgi:DNA-binding IclR family transcriptional regulator
VDLEEFHDGLRCIAAPVREHSGRVVAALGIAGPGHRFLESQVEGLAGTVVRAAGALSRNLGYLEPHVQPATPPAAAAV